VALVRDGIPKSLFHSTSPEWNLDRRVITVRGDLCDLPLLERTINEYGVDRIFHLGAQTQVLPSNRSPISTFESNIRGTWNLLEAARLHSKQIHSVVVASSDKAYGALPGFEARYSETMPLQGRHPYDVSKACTDLIAQAFAKTFELPIGISRCGNLFGPGDLNFDRLIPGVLRAWASGDRPEIRSDGKSTRDYLYVEDAVDALLALSDYIEESPEVRRGEAFNFSYGLRLSVLEVIEALKAELLELQAESQLENWQPAFPRVFSKTPNEITFQSLDSTKARALLGWKPVVGWKKGLRRTLLWYGDFLRSSA
jgi:CDP-glucose 4,6-dehydratase